MAALVRALALAVPVALMPMFARAQAPSTPPADPTTSPSPAAGPAPANTTVHADAPAADSAETARPVIPATGYSYGPPTRYGAPSTLRVERSHARASTSGPPANDASMAGFESLPDGSTRLFVELSKPVAYETRAAGSTFTLVLKEVRVGRRNDRNPLVTVHFNTPVTSARLTPHGRDLWLVVDLRANVHATVTMANTDATADAAGRDTSGATSGGTTVRVGFPKGDYLQVPAPAPATASAPAPSPQQSTASADVH
jgi:hypothetical protein